MLNLKQFFTVAVVGVVVCSAGCSRKRSSGGSSRPAPSTSAAKVANKKVANKKVSAREGVHSVASLLRAASRLELWSRGVFVDLGTADQHKYARGGWRSGWSEVEGSDPTAAGMGRSARVDAVLPHDGARAVVLRARGLSAGLKLSVAVDGNAHKPVEVGGDWSTVTVPLSTPLSAGRHRLDLAVKGRSPVKGPAVAVDWLWLAHDPSASPPAGPRVTVLSLDSPRRALVADPPRRLSHYLAVPPKAALVLDHGADRPTRFRVVLAEDGKKDRVLFDHTSDAARWREQKLDLSAWAGKLVRLDLITEAKQGTPPGAKAGWGEPDVVVPGKAPRPVALSAQNRPQNVIYILIDTARQDVFRPFNPNTHVKTPAFDAFVGHTVLFENAYANAPWTKPSIATLWSGLYPSTHATQGKGSVLPGSVPVLFEHLQKNKVETAGFIANGYVSDKFGFRRGFDTYRNYIREDRNYDAEAVYADALSWLKKPHDKPWFLYIQTIDPHVPYAVPAAYKKMYYPDTYKGGLGPSVSGYETKKWLDGKLELTADDKTYIRALYDAEVSYHDHFFGIFFEQVEAMGLLDHTLVVVSNDHGEELFEHGKTGHGHSLYEELIRSPLLLRYPKLLPAGARVTEPVELVDLAPTMLRMLGLPAMPGTEGASLLDVVAGGRRQASDYAVAEYRGHTRAVRFGPYKLIVGQGGTRLFDLSADPGEKQNLAGARAVARRGCEVRLYEALGIPGKDARLNKPRKRRRHQASSTKVDGKLRKQLEALGYIH